MRKDYIPSRDADFGRRPGFMYRYVSQKRAGQRPEWAYIPPAALTKLGEAQAAWETAGEAGIRPFVNRYLRCPPVTNADRAAFFVS